MDHKGKLLKYTRNENLVDDFEKTNIILDFPIFGDTMKKRFSKSLKNRKTWDKASITLSNNWPIRNPTHLIVEGVLDCLSAEDLEIFCT